MDLKNKHIFVRHAKKRWDHNMNTIIKFVCHARQKSSTKAISIQKYRSRYNL